MIKIIQYTGAAALSLAFSTMSFAAEKEGDSEKPKRSSESTEKVSAHDKAWAQMTALSNAAEIQLAKTAQEKATTEHLKRHAAKMIEDHQKAGDELKEWAKQADVDLKPEMPAAKKAMIQEITSKSGPEFDQAYTEHEIAAHRMALAHYQNGAQFLKDEQLKGFAQKNLPVIQGHLADVEKGGQHSTGTQQPASGRATATSGATQSGDTATSPARQPAAGSQPSVTQPQQSGQVRTE